MAYLCKVKRSPFWYLKYKNRDGKICFESTQLRRSDPKDTKKAQAIRAKMEASEIQRGPLLRGNWDWVDSYLEQKDNAVLSKDRYRTAWRWVSLWLTENRYAPGEIRYHHAAEYVAWRVDYKKHTGKRAGKNTAIFEAKVFSMILGQAVRLEHIQANPWINLEMAKVRATKKRELTEAEIKTCLVALKSEPEWMQRCFLIALHTGCRLRETVIPLDCVDLLATTPMITFPHPKGGEGKAFSIPIPSGLMELFRDLVASSAKTTLTLPFQPSRHWKRFFTGIGLNDVCFHCLRVTRVTRLRREGVPREVAMRLVNHSSELIHMLYDRHQVGDLAKWVDKGQVGDVDGGK